jgi:hypothetical protein
LRPSLEASASSENSAGTGPAMDDPSYMLHAISQLARLMTGTLSL